MPVNNLMKQLKPIKNIPYFFISPVFSIIGEVLFIFALLSILESLVFGYRNMASFFMSMVIGAVIWGIFGLIEYLLRKKYEMKWYTFSVGNYLIPLIFWVITSLISYTNWYSNRLSEDAEFFMYFTRTMLVYLLFASVFRVLGHFFFEFLSRPRRKVNNKKKK